MRTLQIGFLLVAFASAAEVSLADDGFRQRYMNSVCEHGLEFQLSPADHDELLIEQQQDPGFFVSMHSLALLRDTQIEMSRGKNSYQLAEVLKVITQSGIAVNTAGLKISTPKRHQELYGGTKKFIEGPDMEKICKSAGADPKVALDRLKVAQAENAEYLRVTAKSGVQDLVKGTKNEYDRDAQAVYEDAQHVSDAMPPQGTQLWTQ